MRLVAYSVAGERRLGIEAADGIHDLTDTTGARDVGELLASGADPAGNTRRGPWGIMDFES